LSAREAIGVDLGGTKLATGVVDTELNILHESRESSTGRSEDEVVLAIEQELREAMEARPGVVGAGLGIPCTIDRARGLAINAVNLEITDVPIRDIMRERLGIPVFIDNDANCAALAEHRFGAARGAENAILLTVGTGIGGGLIINRQVYRGSTGAAAELGHVVVDESGPPCQGTCPNNGCVETMASGTALAREGTAAAGRHPESSLARELQGGGGISGRVVTEAAQAGDAVALEVVAEAGKHLGVAIASLVNVFDPDVVVVGGGVTGGAGELLVEPARVEMRRRALPPMNRTPVKLAEMGPDAGMIGAAQMVLEELAES
jgi:glucokinase